MGLNFGNPAVLEEYRKNVVNIMTNNSFLWSPDPSTTNVNFGGTMDGVYIDDFGAPLSNYPAPGPIEYGGYSNTTQYRADKVTFLQTIYNNLNPLSKYSIPGMGTTYYWYINQDYINWSHGLFDEIIRFSDLWGAGNEYAQRLRANGLISIDIGQNLVYPAGYRHNIRTNEQGAIGTIAGMDSPDKARMASLAEVILLAGGTSSQVAEEPPDMSYSTKPVTDGLYFPSWYSVDLGTPVNSLQLVTIPAYTPGGYPNQWIFHRTYTDGFIALALRSNGAASTLTYNLTIPTPPSGKVWKHLVTDAVISAGNYTLLNGDAIILKAVSGNPSFPDTAIIGDNFQYSLSAVPPIDINARYTDFIGASDVAQIFLGVPPPPPPPPTGIVYPQDTIINLLSGTLLDADGLPVTVQTEFVQETIKLPVVTVTFVTDTTQWLTLGAKRKRHYTLFDVTAWSLKYSEKWYLTQQIQTLIGANMRKYEGNGFSFLWLKGNRILDNPSVRPVVYGNAIHVEVIWDEQLS